MISHDEYDDLIDERLAEMETLTSWAMDHGWRYGYCSEHGHYWNDSSDCPTCQYIKRETGG